MAGGADTSPGDGRSGARLPAQSCALVVLDGWGIAPDGPGNAISLAATPVFDELWDRYPHTTLRPAALPSACRMGRWATPRLVT